MKHKRSVVFISMLLVMSVGLPFCLARGATAQSLAQTAASDIVDVANMFSKRDTRNSYMEDGGADIVLTGQSALCDSPAVSISGSIVTITNDGTFILSGELNDGMVIVDADKSDKVRLVLNGASVANETSAPIYVKQADKVFITVAGGTSNVLANGGLFTPIDENNIDAVIFSKDDLTLNGEGKLAISSPAGHGVVSKDDLVVAGGSYDITCSNHGLSGKDSVRIAGGSLVVNSGKDAIHSENDDDAALGFVYIAGGSFVLTSGGDGVSAQSALQIDGGDFLIKTGLGADNYSRWSDEASVKGLKATGALVVNAGSFDINAEDDALHSNGSLAVTGGEMRIASGDDGIHADGQVSISGGTISISQSYEGIEGLSVIISGGNISVVATDDGLNAAGGADQSGFGGRRGRDGFMANSEASIVISGGSITIDAEGDGIDSNGSLTVTGGETYVSGPQRGGNGAIDASSQPIITGGVFVAVGASQMAQGFGASSEQGALFVMVDNQSANSAVSLADESGRALISWMSNKSFSSVVISCPDMVQGGVYTLTAGTYENQITLDSLVYSQGGMGGFGMGGRGQRGNRRDRGGDWPEFDDWW